MPNAPRTPIRGVRISDELWQRVQDKAAADGRTASDVIRAALEQYVASAQEEGQG